MPRISRVAFLLLALALSSCAQKAPLTSLSPVLTNFDALPGWQTDRHAEALEAFRRSCGALRKKQLGADIGQGLLSAKREDWLAVCASAQSAANAEIFFRRNFTPFYAAKEGDGLFTGYYEPLLRGSRMRTGPYRYPVYRLPPDVVKGKEYYTRAEIDAGALAGRGLEIAWVDDPVMLFFAHIQGSTRIQLTDGSIIRVGYAGKNNREYVAIGKVLKERGLMKEVDFFSLRQWLYDHPQQAAEIMHTNPSYVFYAEGKDVGGPIGAQGVPLIAERSLAIDDDFIPYSMPLYLLTDLPVTGPAEPAVPYHRLFIAQDTGGAIKGPVRGDVFFGAGRRAEALAGRMKQRGMYVLLVPYTFAYRLR